MIRRMIELTRVRSRPPVHANFCGLRRVNINLKLLKQKRAGELDKKGEKKWNSSFWKEAKAQLLIESHNKCAYCETPTRVVAYGDVEHFRPKSIYWWLAYSYENYLPSCGACNQEYKKDFFELQDKTLRLKGPVIRKGLTDDHLKTVAPTLTVDPVDDTKGKRLKDYVKEIRQEKALLINPYFDDPAIYIAYRPVLENKEVIIVPAASKYKKVIKACENLFGVNRKELLDLRFQQYCYYMTLRHTLADPGILEATKNMTRNRLGEMEADKSAYAGMIRFFNTKRLSELPWDFDITTV